MDFGFTILFVELLIIFVRNCSTCCQSFPNANNPTTVSTTFNSPFIVDSRLSDCGAYGNKREHTVQTPHSGSVITSLMGLAETHQCLNEQL